MFPELQQPDSPEPALGPPRFSLRALLLAVSLLCGLFAVMAAVGMLWSAAIALFLGLILAHVLGNSIGTRLRDEATRQIAAERQAGPLRTTRAGAHECGCAAAADRTGPAASHHAGDGRLGRDRWAASSVAWDLPRSIRASRWRRPRLGVVSAAVLGAFAGFAASSLLSVVRQALAEAHRGAEPMRAPRKRPAAMI